MTEDRLPGMPLPEDWEADVDEGDGKEFFPPSTALWMDQRRSPLADRPGSEVLCSCRGVCDPNLGIYYIDPSDANQLDDPRLQWRTEQEEMIKQYLSVAYKDLLQKKEMCGVKQERLRIAREELNAKMEALQRAHVSTAASLNSALAFGGYVDASAVGRCHDGACGGGMAVMHDPEELRAEVGMVRQRVKKLALELLKIRSSLTVSERGIDALTMVNKKILDRGRSAMNLDEAGEMVRGIRGMNHSIKAGEQRKKELIKSVADLRHCFVANAQNLRPHLMPDPCYVFADTACQTEISGDSSKHFGTIAKLKLNYDQNKKYIADLMEKLVDVENQLVPCVVQYDANRLLLVDEKNKLMEELRRHQSQGSAERVKDLEEDLLKVKDMFQKDVELDAQRLQLTKTRVELEDELLHRTKINATLEMQIKSLNHSMTSISSGSSLGSLGSLSASSKGSQNSVAMYDLYSTQGHDASRSQQQVNLPDLHRRVETIFRDQSPAQCGSTFHQFGPQSYPHPFAYQAPYPAVMEDYDDLSDERGMMIHPFQPYPTVQEEIEDEGFEVGEEEENDEAIAAGECCEQYLDPKPPPSYEDHLQLACMQKTPPPPGACLYQRQSPLYTEPFHQAPNHSIGENFCLYRQQEFQRTNNLIPHQNTHHHLRPHGYVDRFQHPPPNPLPPKQCLWVRASPGQGGCGHLSEAGVVAEANRLPKFFSNVAYPGNLLTSNSLPSLFNSSSLTPMTNCGSESQIFRSGPIENIGEGYPFDSTAYAHSPGKENGDLSDLMNSHLRVDNLPTMSKNLLTEFRVNSNKVLHQQFLDNQLLRRLQLQQLHQQQQQQPNNNNRLRRTLSAKNTCASLPSESPFPASQCVIPALNAFSSKSSSTSHLHSLNDQAHLQATCNYSPVIGDRALSNNSFRKNNNTSSLSLSSSSLGEEGSNLGSDSGVFESTNRLNNVLSAQIQVQFVYDYAKQEILVWVERARNLSALSVHNINEVIFNVFILPCNADSEPPYVEEKEVTSQSNLGQVFHFPVESEKVLSKTIQVYVLRLKDVEFLHRQAYSRVESLGVSLISLASFDLNSSVSSWYNVLSFQFMDVETNKCIQSPASKVELDANSMVAHNNTRGSAEFRNHLAACPVREESSDESTVASSQTSTLTRCEEPEDMNKYKNKNLDSVKNDERKYSQKVRSVKINDPEQKSVMCDKETNTDPQKVSCNPSMPYFLRKPIGPGSKFNRETAIRRWQTFSPAAAAPEGEDHSHKLNRSGSDSSVRRKKSNFDRHAAYRQSIRLKKPSTAGKKPLGSMDLSKNQTSVDLMVDYQAYKTKLESLNKEITALQNIKKKFEEAKEKGETEPAWLMENEDLQLMLMETSGTFRRKARDRERLSDITDLVDRKMRKVKMEMLTLQARKSILDVDRMMFKKKMSFFTSPEEGLSFLDQADSEIDDPVGKDEVEGSDPKKGESKSVPLSIMPRRSSGDQGKDGFENMVF